MPILEAGTALTFSASDEAAMRQALDQAQNAWLVGEVPVGAVIMRTLPSGERQILATGYNRPITTADPTAHAEIVALRHAAQLQGNYRLPECEIFVTLEPCPMCAMALLHARLKRVVFGAADPKGGAAGSVLDLFADRRLNHHTRVERGLLGTASGEMLRAFFNERREQLRQRRMSHRQPPSGARPDTIFIDSSQTPASAADGATDYPPIPSGEAAEIPAE